MTYLLTSITLAALSRPQSPWRAACCVFVGLTLTFYLASAKIPGELYFLYAACMAGMCADMVNPIKGSYPVQVLCLVAVALNLVGWGIYEAGGSSDFYYSAFQVYYFYAILVFIFEGPTSADTSKTWDTARLLRHTY